MQTDPIFTESPKLGRTPYISNTIYTQKQPQAYNFYIPSLASIQHHSAHACQYRELNWVGEQWWVMALHLGRTASVIWADYNHLSEVSG